MPSGNRRRKLTDALLVMAKRPAPSRTKTRLAPPLSLRKAAALYECFLWDTLDLVRQVPEVQRGIMYTPPEEGAYFSQFEPGFRCLPQEGADLGARLDNALRHYLLQGYSRVAIMNSDGPNLPPAYLALAFELLGGGTDVILGPCDDGGYYLIGLKQPAPRLLREVRMSTDRVLADTLAVAAEEGLQVEILPKWYDVDDVASLKRLIVDLAGAPPRVAKHTRRFLERHRDIIEALQDSPHGGNA